MRIPATLALAFVAACGPRLPPPLTPLALKEPVIEAAPEVTDASLFGFVRVRKLPEFLAQLGQATADKLMASVGISPRDLPPEAPLAVFLWDMGDGGAAAMPLAAMIPLPLDSPLSSRMRLILGPDKVIAAPGGTLIAVTPPGLLRARPETDALARLTAAPMSSQLQLHVRMTAIRTRYSAQIDEFFDKLAKTPVKGVAETAGTKRINQQMQSWMHGWVNDLSSLTLDQIATPEYFEAALTLHERAPASATPPPLPRSSPDLVGFLPDGQIRFEFNGDSLRGGFSSMLSGIYNALLKDDPATHARMDGWIKRWGDASAGSLIGGTISLGEKGMNGASLIVSPHADKVMALIEDGYLLMATDPMRNAMRGGAVEFTVERQLAVRKIQGWTVNRYKYVGKPLLPTATPEQKALFEKLNNNTFEIVRVGEYVLQTINQPPSALDALVADVLSGQRHGRPLRAKQDFPMSGLFHADFDAAPMYESFRKLMPPSLKLAPLDSGPPALTIYGYSGAGVSQYRLRVPAGFIAAVRAAFK